MSEEVQQDLPTLEAEIKQKKTSGRPTYKHLFDENVRLWSELIEVRAALARWEDRYDKLLASKIGH